ncbi:MAG: type III-B CRISPR-associated protein Cas10/Cmr2 [Nitrospirota bacterium]
MSNDLVWQTKLHARLHDPAEKALVLLRDPAGHEGGTSRALHRDLGFHTLPVKDWLDPDNAQVLDTVLFKKGIPITMYKTVKRADWWAAGADRPQWPVEAITAQTGNGEIVQVKDWARVRWTERPVLIHPLTGQEFDLGDLGETDIGDIKTQSFNHFSSLILKEGEQVDWQRTLLAFWRFGPELREDEAGGKLGHLWPLLPADTRVPDHSIWDHLDLTSAFAGAFAADPQGEAALLTLSIGPVQSFIAAARSTSDLWAGSHLLSRLSWEAMKVVCERLGPDAIVFPRLRGVPQVDVWLRDEMCLPAQWFDGSQWAKRMTDANPLFAAALPNRFVAVVPASEAQDIAHSVMTKVRTWIQELGKKVVDRLLRTAGLTDDTEKHCHVQMRDQLRGFPEVHWAVVPFSLIRSNSQDKQTGLDVTRLSEAMAPFFGVAAGQACGFLATAAWQVLQKEAKFADGITFFSPKPGVFYPAVYDLAERVLASAKSARPFDQQKQMGWRDSLTGENEWLTDDPDLLTVQAGKRKSPRDKSFKPGEHVETLWAKIADEKPAWAKKGEHLGGLSAIKRLWPTLFAEEVAQVTGQQAGQVPRFVVSTHTMALAHQLDEWLDAGAPMSAELRDRLTGLDPVPLPRKLAGKHSRRDSFEFAKQLPALLDAAREDGNEHELRQVVSLIKKAFAQADGAQELPGLETYYALLLMDGDHMGRILSGDPSYAISYFESFHPTVRQGFEERALHNNGLKAYGSQQRALSPNRHLAVSGALNDFALHVVPEIIENEHLGRVLYAGGDDVLAMLPVADVLSAMRRLRCAYSGDDPSQAHVDWRDVRRHSKERTLVCKKGYAYVDGRLMRMMGTKATASCGAVIAHHQAPLAMVLRELRLAEKRAKTEGGRDAFSITVIKRSGGLLEFTAKWGEPLNVLLELRDFLADPAVSRRAVYNSLLWVTDLPPNASQDMVGNLLAYQFRRQTSSDQAWTRHEGDKLSNRIAALACTVTEKERFEWLSRLLGVAEFLAREARVGTDVGEAVPAATSR